MLPEIDPGPDRMLKVTPRAELADPDKDIGLTPYDMGDAGVVKVIDCDALEIVKVVEALAAL